MKPAKNKPRCSFYNNAIRTFRFNILTNVLLILTND